MIKRSLAILLLSFCLGAGSRQAVGLDAMSSGADAMARGGAYLGDERSNHYVFQNYALLARNPQPRFSLTAFNLISEVGYFAAAYSQSNFSLGFLRLQESGGELRDSAGNPQGGEISYMDSTLYGAYTLNGGAYSLGLRAKFQNKYFSEVDVSARGLALDLAGAYQVRPYLVLGAELNNLAATTLLWSNGLEENFGQSLGLGALFKIFGADGYWRAVQPLNLYADIRANTEDYFLSSGLEYWPCPYVALRGGLKQARDVRAEHSAKLTEFAAGLGFNYANVYVDYAYNLGDDLADNVTHFFTVSYCWIEPAPPVQKAVVVPVKVVSGVKGAGKVKPPPKKYKRTFRSTIGNAKL